LPLLDDPKKEGILSCAEGCPSRSDDPVTKLQTDALERAECNQIFRERASGTKTDRPELARLIDTLRKGDVLVVWELDRLGRSSYQQRLPLCDGLSAPARARRWLPFVSASRVRHSMQAVAQAPEASTPPQQRRPSPATRATANRTRRWLPRRAWQLGLLK
jgi:hypothetical protein